MYKSKTIHKKSTQHKIEREKQQARTNCFVDHSCNPISEFSSIVTPIGNTAHSANIIQPLTDVDFTLTTLFSFTSSPSLCYHVVVVVIVVVM